MAPHSTFSRKKWNGVPVLAAKNSTLLPKVELLCILANRQKRTPHGIRCQFGCQIYINFSKLVSLVITTHQFEAKDIFTIIFIFSDFCTTAKPSNCHRLPHDHGHTCNHMEQALSLQLRSILKWQLTSIAIFTLLPLESF